MTLEEYEGDSELKPEYRAFCIAYTSLGEETFGNGSKSYAKAYPKANHNDASTRVSASRLLTKEKIKGYISALLKANKSTHDLIDARLSDIIVNGNDSNAVQAINAYNKLNGRILEEVKISFGQTREELEAELKKLQEKTKR